ncbi:MAG TPA: hypothetical protein VHZ32_13020 [Rhizomicrobium sp.]|jgi:hypothetical protein|nr:hypothetical protein [Rhizomicrobium sp.]
MKAIWLAMVIIGLSAPVSAGAVARPTAPVADNPEMKALFADDQRVRQPGYKGGWKDEPRRLRVRELLAKDALKTAMDFEKAAFIFQHGDTPDDFLLAHTLAIVAVAKGRPTALWIASATLDRYLQHIGQKQIYGTQYQILDRQGRPGLDGHWSQEPYDRNLISDTLRHDIGMPSQAEQRVQFEKYQRYFNDVQDRMKAQAAK